MFPYYNTEETRFLIIAEYIFNNFFYEESAI
jgi:hypothetical protein